MNTISAWKQSGPDRIRETIRKLKELQPVYHAAVTVIDPEKRIAELEKQSSRGPFYGVPVVLKDNVCMKDTETTASSGILQGFVPVYNAHVTDLLEKAGAIVIAKSSMDELAMGGTNRTAFTGPVLNPYGKDRIPGGSSGGSAVLTSLGVVPLAIGTDTGDSIRKPAAYCNVVGVKPTYGRISRYGVIPYASSLDHVGYFTNNVSDAAYALEILAGKDERDMTSSDEPVKEYSKNLGKDIRGKKIAVFGNVYDTLEDGEVKKTFDRVVRGFTEKGAVVEKRYMDEKLFSCVTVVYFIISNCEASSNHANLDGIRFGLQEDGDSYEDIMIKTRTKGFSTLIRERFIIGSYGLFRKNREEIFLKAQKVRRLIVEDYRRMAEGFDAVIAPTCPHGAPKFEDDDDKTFRENNAPVNYLPIMNFSGDPSMSVPMGFEGEMPVGLCISAKAFDEETMFETAYAAEQIVRAEENA